MCIFLQSSTIHLLHVPKLPQLLKTRGYYNYEPNMKIFKLTRWANVPYKNLDLIRIIIYYHHLTSSTAGQKQQLTTLLNNRYCDPRIMVSTFVLRKAGEVLHLYNFIKSEGQDVYASTVHAVLHVTALCSRYRVCHKYFFLTCFLYPTR